jgi:putative ABC transport system ATP-binding protein
MQQTILAAGLKIGFGAARLRQEVLAVQLFSARIGELIFVKGPSGSGKSTLMAILSGLLRPEEGEVRLMGQTLGEMSVPEQEALRRRHCGFVFQSANLFPALTAQQQLEIALSWASDVPQDEVSRRAHDCLVAVGLKAQRHLRPQELSGGEKQRVAIARAMAKKPAVVFTDEPTAALDWDNGQLVLDLLIRAAREDRSTVVTVTHDQRLIDRARQRYPQQTRILRLENRDLIEERVVS